MPLLSLGWRGGPPPPGAEEALPIGQGPPPPGAEEGAATWGPGEVALLGA
jgi:hypothetical protein